MLDSHKIKFNESVWHDQSYMHPQLGKLDRDFYDRHGDVSKVEDVLRSLITRKPVVLIGERRAGKTSMLRRMAHSFENDPRFMSVEIPWMGINSSTFLMREVLQTLYFKLDTLLPEDRLSPSTINRAHTVTDFLHIMQDILPFASNRIVILCIDELDSMLQDSPPKERGEILGVINALLEAHHLPLRLLLTTTRPPGELESTSASPLTAKSEQIRLRPFSKPDLDEMVLGILGRDVPLSPQDLQLIFDLSGGWPYFAKLLLLHFAQLTPGTANLEQAASIAIRDNALRQSMEHIYNKHFSDSERAVFLLLAKRGGRITIEEMQVGGIAFQVAAQRLVERDFLLHEADGSYHFRIGLLQGWFSQWPRLDDEARVYLKDVLLRLKRLEDPWASAEFIEVSRDDLRRRGL
jgi:hypothetical protein